MSWHTTTLPSETEGIGFDYRFKQYLVKDSLTGFLIGNNMGAEISNSTDESRSIEKSNYQTVLFKTQDGGLSFKKSTLGKGSLEKIVSDTQNNLYTIKTTYEPDSINTQKYYILKSTDLGESWKEISDFKTYKVKNIQFYDELKGIVCVDEEETGYLALKTIDGGVTWKEFYIDSKEVNILDLTFINENELFTGLNTEGIIQTATIAFDTGKVKIHTCDLPEGHSFSSFFKDGNTLYSEVYKYAPNESHQLMLYNHNTQKLVKYDFTSSGEELSLGITISGNYIGLLRQDSGKTYYFYSNDSGKNWIKEELPDPLTTGHPVAIHGKGLVWIRNAVRNIYDFQVRKPDVF